MNKLEKQKCPVCGENKLNLIEKEMDIPYFGKAYLFSMKCSGCDYFLSDVEFAEEKEPCKIEFEILNKKDLNVRIVKSSNATIKIPQMRTTIEPGVSSEGYVSNIEGLLNRYKKILEGQRDSAEEDSARKTAKNLLKKLWKVECGDEELKIVLEDQTGNSAIISDKSQVEKLKVK